MKEIITNYSEAIQAIKRAILTSRYRAAALANKELLSLYYGVGKYISENSKKGFWGIGAIETISERLQKELPGLKGFSAGNMKKMRIFFEQWCGFIENRVPATHDLDSSVIQDIKNRSLPTHDLQLHLLNEIRPADEKNHVDLYCFLTVGFTHHYEILKQTTQIEERIFYIERCATEFWSVENLKYHLKSNLFAQQGHTLYFSANPDGYSNNLRDMMKKTKHHFNYDLLTEIRDGRFDRQDDLLTFLPNVRYVLQSNEAYGRFASFMSSLRIEAKSLQEPSNAIRKVYLDFRNGTPQRWKLIDPKEYSSALKNNQSLTNEKVSQWVAMAKENIQLFAANSYLTSGPCLDPRVTNSEGQNTFYLLWYYLTGDEQIPYQAKNRISKEELNVRERYFNKTYWNPFVNYMGTSFGDGGKAFETDSTLNPLYDLVAEFERYQMDAYKNLVTLTRLIDIVHGRGTISYLFIENDNCSAI